MDLADLAVGYAIGTLPLAVLLLKGRVAMFFVAGAATLVPVIGLAFAIGASLRLGKPNSWWARRWYPARKLSAARARFPETPSEPATMSAAFGLGVLVAFGPVATVLSFFVATT